MAGIGALDHDVPVNNNSGGGGFTLLAEDDYELEIIESDVKANGTGKGQNANFKVQVVSGPHKGTSFYSDITSIQHESAQAQAIGQGQLKALCCAAGVDFTSLTDTEQLHYRPFWAHVIQDTYFSKKHQKDMTNNKISKFLWEGMPEDDAPRPPAEKAAASEPPKQPEPEKPATGRRPWDKK
jgi:hypothetical protein